MLFVGLSIVILYRNGSNNHKSNLKNFNKDHNKAIYKNATESKGANEQQMKAQIEQKYWWGDIFPGAWKIGEGDGWGTQHDILTKQ